MTEFRSVRLWLIVLFLSPGISFIEAADPAPPVIKVSENGRFLMTGAGQPFFYLADTAWELLHRLDEEQTEHYLRTRAEQGFTVIQAVVLAELDGLRVPNTEGHLPLVDLDPRRPDEAYFKHVDHVVARANELGLTMGLLPTWGDKWNKKWGVGPEVFTPENARDYGRWLGKRYREASLIWILGGDRPVENDAHREIIKAMAAGLREGMESRQLITFHPSGGGGSAQYFHAEPWLSFNMRQNGHQIEFTDRYDQTRVDYDRQPVKPVLDGEPVYEDHPVSFKAKSLGHSIAADCRRPLYWNLFTGACGHTYGHHSVWQMFDAGRSPVNDPLMTWKEALEQPGATQMRHGRRLMESRPYFSRLPDDSIIVPAKVTTAIPGAGTRRLVATRDADGRYAMVYVPIGRSFQVRMDVIRSAPVQGWWFNTRNGAATLIGQFSNEGVREFTPPDRGEMTDWVLVLDEAAAAFGAPGASTKPASR